jgi:molybdenum cofactor cytidylyltransferase
MICAIILAAGRSRRMGAQELLLPFGGGTVIGHIVDEVLRSPVDHTIVVVGQEGARIAEALAGRRRRGCRGAMRIDGRLGVGPEPAAGGPVK